MKYSILGLLTLTAMLGVNTAGAGETPAPEDAAAYILAPTGGTKVKSPVKVVFSISGMELAPAGMEKANTGHHHLLIDTPLPEGEALNAPLPKDEKHLHFGKGETEAMVELAPGTHTLQLLLGDHNHVPHNKPVYSAPVTITVE